MTCPFCGHEKNRVVDTAATKNTVYRKRKCCECSSVWMTLETIESSGESFKKLNKIRTLRRTNG